MTEDTLWSIVVPVKRLATAKSRLARFAGPRRSDLALAVASDTVLAALNCDRVGMVVVVTDDGVAADRLAGFEDADGALVVTGDVPDAGLNPALRHGAAVATRLRPGFRAGAMSADLPALRPVELARVLDAAAAVKRAFLADAAGVGTTFYASAPGTEFAPAFGGESRLRHLQSGATEITAEGVPSARLDVDTPEDLRRAVALGVGPHTAKVAAELGVLP